MRRAWLQQPRFAVPELRARQENGPMDERESGWGTGWAKRGSEARP